MPSLLALARTTMVKQIFQRQVKALALPPWGSIVFVFLQSPLTVFSLSLLSFPSVPILTIFCNFR